MLIAGWLIGCGPNPGEYQAPDPSVKFSRGSSIRLINVTGAEVTATVDGQKLRVYGPDSDVALFSRIRPRPQALQVKVGNQNLELAFDAKSDATYTILCYPDKGKKALALFEGDLTKASEKNVAARIVNASEQPLQLESPSRATLGPRSAGDTLQNAPGKVELVGTVGGQKVSALRVTEPGQAVIGVVYASKTGPQAVWLLTNPPMKIGVAGSSAAG